MGWGAWEHSLGREEVGGLEGGCGDLVNKSAENNSLDFSIHYTKCSKSQIANR